MQIGFSPEEEARLSQIAGFCGTDAEHLVRTTVSRLLDENGRFHKGAWLNLHIWGRKGEESGTSELVFVGLPCIAVYHVA